MDSVPGVRSPQLDENIVSQLGFQLDYQLDHQSEPQSVARS